MTPRPRVTWMGKDAIEKYSGTEPYLLISILSPDGVLSLPADPYRIAVKHLSFHDLHTDQVEALLSGTLGRTMARQLYTRRMAIEVIDFLRRHRDKAELVVIHCEAGVSRSASMAHALMDAMRFKGRRGRNRFPLNPLVYGLTVWAARYFDRVEFVIKPEKGRVVLA